MDPVSVYIPSRIPGTSDPGSARQLCIALVGRPWRRGSVRYDFFLKIWIHLIHRQTQIKEKNEDENDSAESKNIVTQSNDLQNFFTPTQIGQNILWPNQQMKTLHLQN